MLLAPCVTIAQWSKLHQLSKVVPEMGKEVSLNGVRTLWPSLVPVVVTLRAPLVPVVVTLRAPLRKAW